MRSLTRRKKKIEERSFQKANWFDKRRDFYLEDFIALNFSFPEHVLTLILKLTIQKSVAHHNRTEFTSFNFATSFSLVFLPCDYAEGKCTTRKVYGRPKCGCDAVCGKEWRWELTGRIGNVQALSCGLWLGEVETQTLWFCNGDIGYKQIEPDTRQSFEEVQLCSKVEN